MIQDELFAAGYKTVQLASTEQDAIRMAKEQCPDLITVDEELDSGSGVAAIRHICRDRSIPAVFIVTDSRKVQRAIPDATVLLKPFSEKALKAAIGKARETTLQFG